METFDSQGKISPIGAAEQGIVSKKITEKDGQGQRSRHQPPKKVSPLQLPEEPDEHTPTEDHVIDIIV